MITIGRLRLITDDLINKYLILNMSISPLHGGLVFLEDSTSPKKVTHEEEKKAGGEVL